MAPKSAYFSNSGRGAILFLRAGKESEPAGNDPEEETTMKKLIALALTALIPVSYTHLDVYKRQILDSAKEESA